MMLAKILLKPTIVTRGQWGAEIPLKEGEPIREEVNKLVLTFTQTEECATRQECVALLKEVQRRHVQEEGLPDIQHNFLIGGDGCVYEGRGFKTHPSYPKDDPGFKDLINNAIEIAFIGKIDKRPTFTMLKAIAGVVMKGMDDNKITKDMTKIKPWVRHGKNVMLLRDQGNKNKSTSQLFKEYNEMLKNDAKKSLSS